MKHVSSVLLARDLAMSFISMCGEQRSLIPPHPLGSSHQHLSWKTSSKLGHGGWLSWSEGLNPVFLVYVALHHPPPHPFKRRCDESWQFPALRTEFHGLVPIPCVQSMVFSSLAWLHQTSQLLSPCVAFFFLSDFINEKDSSISASLYFFSVLPVYSNKCIFIYCLKYCICDVNVGIHIWLLGIWYRILTEQFSKAYKKFPVPYKQRIIYCI